MIIHYVIFFLNLRMKKPGISIYRLETVHVTPPHSIIHSLDLKNTTNFKLCLYIDPSSFHLHGETIYTI